MAGLQPYPNYADMPQAALQNPQQGLANGLGGAFPQQGFGQALGGLGDLVSAPQLTWKDRLGQAERRALRLFKDMYGHRALIRYLYRGYVDHRDKTGRVYRVYRQKHKEIDVFQKTGLGLKQVYRLCVVDTEAIPITDAVMKRLWLAKANPSELHAQANVKSA